MAKTLLDSVNEVLRRGRLIAGDAGTLTSLTDDARQSAIDVAVQAVNEGIEELYTASNKSQPSEQAESTITLVAADRDYTLATDLLQIHWPLIDKTNNQFIYEHAGGYADMLISDAEQDDTGLPYTAAIRPTDGLLHLDRAPTSIEAGRVYTYQYDKDVSLSLAADTMPFSDAVFRAMVPAWHQIWKREFRNEFDGGMFDISIGRASRLLTQGKAREHYNPRAMA